MAALDMDGQSETNKSPASTQHAGLFLAQSIFHRGISLFGLNLLPLPHGRQRFIDASPHGAAQRGA